MKARALDYFALRFMDTMAGLAPAWNGFAGHRLTIQPHSDWRVARDLHSYLTAWKADIILLYQLLMLVAPLRLERRFRASETPVLPLDDRAIFGVQGGTRTHRKRFLRPSRMPIPPHAHLFG